MKKINIARINESIINKDQINDLINIFPDGGRFLFHDSDSSNLHVMLINFPPNTTYPKHIHHTKSEFYFIMSGSLNIEIFNENYVTIEVIVLERGYGFLLKEGQIHTTASGGDGAIFFEIRSGPLDRDDSKIL